jgi:hypothetical protein
MNAKPTYLAIRLFSNTLPFLVMYFTLFNALSLDASDLVDNSPFVPDDFSPDYSRLINAPGNSNREFTRILEFRGFYSLAGEYYFNIYNNAKQKSDWVKIRETESPYHVLRFERNTNLIYIKFNSRTEKLPLVRPTHEPSPIIISQQKEIVQSAVLNKPSINDRKPSIVKNTSPLRRRVITTDK